MKYVQVVFQPGSRSYAYQCLIDVEVNELVIVQVANSTAPYGVAVARVIEVSNVPSAAAKKYVIGKVDLDTHEKMLKRQQEILRVGAALKSKLTGHMLRKQLEELSAIDPETKELVAMMEELQGWNTLLPSPPGEQVEEEDKQDIQF